jgi:NAD(P)-dependent dehydrogenase (short-subunit alcohol dehydrogenase family)
MRELIELRKNELEGKVAVVTGGGRGLGRAIAKRLAEAGAAVAVAARTEAELRETVAQIEQGGGRAALFVADVTDAAGVERLVSEIQNSLGEVDILVNNAGKVTPLGPVWEASPEAWLGCVDVNLRGPFLCSRALLPGMVARKRGKIITVASGVAFQAYPYLSPYSVGKTAVVRLMEAIAVEGKEHGLQAFCIDPGTVRTAMTDEVTETPEGKKWLPWFPSIFEAGRDMTEGHIAELAAICASGRADALSGCYLSVLDDVADLIKRAAAIREADQLTLRFRPA